MRLQTHPRGYGSLAWAVFLGFIGVDRNRFAPCGSGKMEWHAVLGKVFLDDGDIDSNADSGPTRSILLFSSQRIATDKEITVQLHHPAKTKTGRQPDFADRLGPVGGLHHGLPDELRRGGTSTRWSRGQDSTPSGGCFSRFGDNGFGRCNGAALHFFRKNGSGQCLFLALFFP